MAKSKRSKAIDTDIDAMVRAFESPEGLAFLKATDAFLRGPRAPTKSGYWIGYFTGEPVDHGRHRPGIPLERARDVPDAE